MATYVDVRFLTPYYIKNCEVVDARHINLSRCRARLAVTKKGDKPVSPKTMADIPWEVIGTNLPTTVEILNQQRRARVAQLELQASGNATTVESQFMQEIALGGDTPLESENIPVVKEWRPLPPRAPVVKRP